MGANIRKTPSVNRPAVLNLRIQDLPYTLSHMLVCELRSNTSPMVQKV